MQPDPAPPLTAHATLVTDYEASCVVVAFHRPAQLAELLSAIETDNLERIVVNVDADPEVRAAAAARGAVSFDLTGNPGYGAAVNFGVTRAHGDIIVFKNDDLVIGASDVHRLVSAAQGGDGRVVVPRLVHPDGSTERTIAALPTPSSLALEWMLLPDAPVPVIARCLHPQKWRAPAFREPIQAAMAAVVAAPRDVLLQEPIPEAYFMYWEEMEWFWRLAARRVPVVYEPSATAVHGGGREEVGANKSRLLARNAVRCVRRTQGSTQAALAWIVVIAWNLRLVVVDAGRALRAEPARARLGARVAGLAAAVAAVTELR